VAIHDRVVGAGRQARPAASRVIVSGVNAETCESCGREFSCGAQDAQCWCAAVTLGPERLAVLREHFQRCLCPDCLGLAASVQDLPVRR
jgi:hypothetical protein